MFQENVIITMLRDFFLMAALPFPAEVGNPDQLITQALATLENELAMGTTITEMPNIPFTPLMIYACLDITDERLQAELDRGKKHITKNIIFKSADHYLYSLTAMTMALMFSSEKMIEHLYSLDCFPPEWLEKDARLVARMNALPGMRFLREKNINLFEPSPFLKNTALHFACELGFTAMAKEILASNPSEEELCRKTRDGKDAYTLALETNHHECAALFQGTKVHAWKKVTGALKNKNLRELIHVIDSHEDMALWHGPHYDRHISLLGLAMALKAMDNNPVTDAINDYVQSYVDSQSHTVQINSVLLAIANLSRMDDSRFAEPIQALHQTLLDLSPHYKNVDFLVIDAYYMPEDIVNAIACIIKADHLSKVDFAFLESGLLDERQPSTHEDPSEAGIRKLIIACLSNTSLLEFDADMPLTHDGFMGELFNIILERNQQIAAATEPTMKTRVFNNHVLKINTFISIICEINKLDGIVSEPETPDASQFKQLSQRPYNDAAHRNLRSLLSFRMANKEEYKASKEAAEAHPELAALISASAIASGERTPSLFLDVEAYLVRRENEDDKKDDLVIENRSNLVTIFTKLLAGINKKTKLSEVELDYIRQYHRHERIRFQLESISLALKEITSSLTTYENELNNIPDAEKTTTQRFICDSLNLSDNIFYKLHLYLKKNGALLPDANPRTARKLNDFLSVISITPLTKQAIQEATKQYRKRSGLFSLFNNNSKQYNGEFASLMSKLYFQPIEVTLDERKAYKTMLERQKDNTLSFEGKLYLRLTNERAQDTLDNGPRFG